MESRRGFVELINGMVGIRVWDWVEMQGMRVGGKG